MEENICECDDDICSSWHCEEVKQRLISDDVESEITTCTHMNTNNVCLHWTSESKSNVEFEFMHCDCLQQNNFTCLHWYCREYGFYYFYPNMLMNLLSLPSMLMWTIHIFFFKHKYMFIGNLFLQFVVTFIILWLSGIFGLIIHMITEPVILFGVYSFYVYNKKNRISIIKDEDDLDI